MQAQYHPSLSSGVYGACIYHPNLHSKVVQKDGLTVGSHFESAESKCNLYISYGSVVDASTDIIVNAADEYMLGGDGVDGAITEAGGAELDQYRRAVPFVDDDVLRGVRCPTGEARITRTGGKLKCKHFVIHAVGPDYSKMLKFKQKSESKAQVFERADQLLYDCYAASMRLARQQGKQSIAFSLISAGIFRGQQSLETVLEISARAIKDHLYDELEALHMVAFTGNELLNLQKVLPNIWGQAHCEFPVETSR